MFLLCSSAVGVEDIQRRIIYHRHGITTVTSQRVTRAQLFAQHASRKVGTRENSGERSQPALDDDTRPSGIGRHLGMAAGPFPSLDDQTSAGAEGQDLCPPGGSRRVWCGYDGVHGGDGARGEMNKAPRRLDHSSSPSVERGSHPTVSHPDWHVLGRQGLVRL
ncbi:hypothetical protein DPEC_G00202790 [Dallia pectoralis]|uniref:Uncharacterized protein n=1 Tax=Dallia pectoralis TaxID=75939 RepID=A0ACC2G9C7_DALPE|nr:hypothetical protein DPEC_G00202790 [Dallia pectoralis]